MFRDVYMHENDEGFWVRNKGMWKQNDEKTWIPKTPNWRSFIRNSGAQATLTDQKGQGLFLGVSPINTKNFLNKETAPFEMLGGKGNETMGSFNISIGLDGNDKPTGARLSVILVLDCIEYLLTQKDKIERL